MQWGRRAKDGQVYTYAEFEEYYGEERGMQCWRVAEEVLPFAATVGEQLAHAVAPANGPACEIGGDRSVSLCVTCGEPGDRLCTGCLAPLWRRLCHRCMHLHHETCPGAIEIRDNMRELAHYLNVGHVADAPVGDP